jgi:hypothetical protein
MRLVASWLIVLADVTVDPTTNGMPGAGLIQQILNWLAQAALWGSLGAILAGAGLFWVGHQAGNFAGASRGKTLAVAGAVGACLAGVAPTAVNLLYRAAR